MIDVKKKFLIKKSQLSKKFRVENNNLDISALISKSGHKAVKMKDIAKPHRNERDKKATADKKIKYVQISDIDVSIGRIKSYRRFVGAEAPNNARRIMRHGEILISTRRPTRGAIVAVPKELDGEICSVFFCSLKVNDWNETDPWYLALFLRTSLARFQFQAMTTETAYPVINDDDVENMLVLLPDIDVQRKIAQDYHNSVESFFKQMNNAYASIQNSIQDIEDYVLRDDAEKIPKQTFGLEFEEIEEVENVDNAES